MLSILRKARLKDKELRILMLYVALLRAGMQGSEMFIAPVHAC